MRFLFGLFLSAFTCAAFAQQDNSIQSQMIFNMNDGSNGGVNVTDRVGNKVIITVQPDTQGPVKVDAMLAAQSAINDILPIMVALITHFPTCVGQEYWCPPMKAARVKVEAVKAKLDALYPPPPLTGTGQ